MKGTENTEMRSTENTEEINSRMIEKRNIRGAKEVDTKLGILKKTTPKGTDYDKYPHSRLTEKIINCAIEVHKSLGCGYVESAYENALVCELKKRGLRYEQQKPIDIFYGNFRVGRHKIDLVIENKVIVELKHVRRFCATDVKRLLSYLKATNIKLGLLINFAKVKIEVKRVIL